MVGQSGLPQGLCPRRWAFRAALWSTFHSWSEELGEQSHGEDTVFFVGVVVVVFAILGVVFLFNTMAVCEKNLGNFS